MLLWESKKRLTGEKAADAKNRRRLNAFISKIGGYFARNPRADEKGRQGTFGEGKDKRREERPRARVDNDGRVLEYVSARRLASEALGDIAVFEEALESEQSKYRDSISRRERRAAEEKGKETLRQVAGRTETFVQRSDVDSLGVKSFYKTRKGVSQRVMALQPELSTSETDGATLSSANLGILFDIHKGFDPKLIKQATGWERGKDGKWRYEESDMMDGVKAADIKELNAMAASLGLSPHTTLGELLGKEHSLFKAYPELAEMEVAMAPEKVMKGAKGSVAAMGDKSIILLNDDVNGSVSLLESHIKLVQDDIQEAEDGLDEIGTEAWRRRREFYEEDTDAEAARAEALAVIAQKKKTLANLEQQLEQAKRDADNSVRSTLAHEVQHVIQRIEGFATKAVISFAA